VYGTNAQDLFRAASVNKLPILVTVYQRAALGQLNLDQSVTIGDADIQHYGTGTIQIAGAPRTYSIRQLAALMAQLSDNTAAYVLERLLGQTVVQTNLRRWGLNQTSMADNVTTPADAAGLMAALYAGRLLPADASSATLALLEQTVFDERLASGLPAGVM